MEHIRWQMGQGIICMLGKISGTENFRDCCLSNFREARGYNLFPRRSADTPTKACRFSALMPQNIQYRMSHRISSTTVQRRLANAKFISTRTCPNVKLHIVLSYLLSDCHSYEQNDKRTVYFTVYATHELTLFSGTGKCICLLVFLFL